MDSSLAYWPDFSSNPPLVPLDTSRTVLDSYIQHWTARHIEKHPGATKLFTAHNIYKIVIALCTINLKFLQTKLNYKKMFDDLRRTCKNVNKTNQSESRWNIRRRFKALRIWEGLGEKGTHHFVCVGFESSPPGTTIKNVQFLTWLLGYQKWEIL